ncbi:hypothetical protein B0H17DRAFT_1227553 [Mycena rosella]|uniref:Uncharacterized protein n=1 Tax=Mycena rosella TaxID=1033263 RepID=A0AAD7D868_MYCRO|nr:hypothetical protein B0H17DRAFT_1227553 [Mycena rosella]
MAYHPHETAAELNLNLCAFDSRPSLFNFKLSSETWTAAWNPDSGLYASVKSSLLDSIAYPRARVHAPAIRSSNAQVQAAPPRALASGAMGRRKAYAAQSRRKLRSAADWLYSDALARRREMRLICGGVGRADEEAAYLFNRDSVNTEAIHSRWPACALLRTRRNFTREETEGLCIGRMRGTEDTRAVDYSSPAPPPCKAAVHVAERRTRADRHTQTAPNAAHARWPAGSRAGSACAAMASTRAWASDAAARGEFFRHAVDPKSTKERAYADELVLEAGQAHGAQRSSSQMGRSFLAQRNTMWAASAS